VKAGRDFCSHGDFRPPRKTRKSARRSSSIDRYLLPYRNNPSDP
jgi:hypothetical protein